VRVLTCGEDQQAAQSQVDGCFPAVDLLLQHQCTGDVTVQRDL